MEYKAIVGLPASRVPGHAGRVVITPLSRHQLLVARGRVHLYEGWSADDVVINIQLKHARGIKNSLLTNEAGTLNKSYGPGTWMVLSDQINLLNTCQCAESQTSLT